MKALAPGSDSGACPPSPRYSLNDPRTPLRAWRRRRPARPPRSSRSDRRRGCRCGRASPARRGRSRRSCGTSPIVPASISSLARWKIRIPAARMLDRHDRAMLFDRRDHPVGVREGCGQRLLAEDRRDTALRRRDDDVGVLVVRRANAEDIDLLARQQSRGNRRRCLRPGHVSPHCSTKREVASGTMSQTATTSVFGISDRAEACEYGKTCRPPPRVGVIGALAMTGQPDDRATIASSRRPPLVSRQSSVVSRQKVSE